tara:strand:- start:814 stop:1653 length:840 start_codon:yes stop_codon:yes gene_type:complete
MFICPKCHSKLSPNLKLIPKKCSKCNTKINFHKIGGTKSVPLLLKDAESYSLDPYIKRVGANNTVVRGIYSYFSVTKKKIPFLNKYALSKLPNLKILVIGGGTLSFGMEKFMRKFSEYIYFSDIYVTPLVDVVCDAHNLPFSEFSFDVVICTSVFEHLENPDIASKNIYKVLKNEGILYSEIPFLQSVHEKDFDFTRYTMNGHLKLFNDLNPVEYGISKGFYITLLWMIRDQIQIFNKLLAKVFFTTTYPVFFILDELFRDFFKDTYCETYLIAKKEVK